MKILVITRVWNFIKDTIKIWESRGYKVERHHCYDSKLAKDADIIFFEFVGKELAEASHCLIGQKKRLVGRLLRIEYYKGAINKSIDWTKVHSLIIVSEYLYGKIKSGIQADTLGECLKRTHFVPCGVNQHRLSFKEHGPGLKIGWMAKSLWYRKDPIKAIACLYALRNHYKKDYELFMAGGGSDKGIPAYIEYLKGCYPELLSKVHFVGTQDPSLFYEDKNFFLSTSFNESFCYVIAEAMTRGIKPLIWDFESSNLIWPRELTFFSDEDLFALIEGPYESAKYRKYVIDNYSIEKQIEAFDRIFIGG